MAIRNILRLLVGLALVAVLGPKQLAEAQPKAPHVQVFGQVEQHEVAVAQAFNYRIEMYATPGVSEATTHVREAFEQAQFSGAPDGLRVERWHAIEVEDGTTPADPMVLRRRVTLRAERVGVQRIPSFEVSLGEQAWSTAPVDVTVYAVHPSFFQARSAIFPIVAEQRKRSGTGSVRVGSAFLVAPDAIATSLHVVLDARRVRVMLPGGREVVSKKVWVADPARDVALLHLDPGAVRAAGLLPLSLAPLDGGVASHRADPCASVVFTFGWPGGQQHSTAGLCYQGATLHPDERVWVSANAVRPGDSGGPLLDRYGQVIGVVSAGTVGGHRSDVLREEVTLSFDLRPALAQRLLVARPRSLRALMKDSEFNLHPHVQAIRLTSLLSMRRWGRGGVAASLEELEAGLQQTPDHAHLHFLHGMIHQLLGTRSQAAEAYRASLKTFEGNFMASYMLGLYHLQRGEYDEAERLFRQTRRYRPYYHFASHGLAKALMGRQQYEDAMPLLRIVITHDPGYAPALYDLALCALALGDTLRARQLLVKLEALSPVRAHRLRRVLREPVLHPRRVEERPRAVLHSFQPGQ